MEEYCDVCQEVTEHEKEWEEVEETERDYYVWYGLKCKVCGNTTTERY